MSAKFKPTPAFKTLKKKLAQARTARVNVGVLGAGDYGDGMTVVGVAAAQEFGSPAAGVPQRSFIWRTGIEKRTEIAAMQKRLAQAITVKGRISVERGLDQLGLFFVGEIKKTIATGTGVPPPNAPSTIARKKSDQPLIGESGQLFSAISHVVDMKGTRR